MTNLFPHIPYCAKTLRRDIKDVNGITSYTHRGRFITLLNIPVFDKNGIWYYKDIGFTKLKNSLDLIVSIIDKSGSITKKRIEDILKIKISKQIQILLLQKRLNRVKVGATYCYLSDQLIKDQKRDKQLFNIDIEEYYDKKFNLIDLIAVLKAVLSEYKIDIKRLDKIIKKYSLDVPIKRVEQLILRVRFVFKKKAIALLKDLRAKFQNNEKLLRELSHLTIRLYPEKKSCIICKKKTNLLKTSWKGCYSYQFGKFNLIEGFFFCKDHKYIFEDSNKILKYHSQLATEIVERRFRVTIDMVVKVGLLRYRDHLQLGEIQTFLKCSSAKVDFPVSTIGMISKRFLEYCKFLHEKYEYKIKEDIDANGGFVLHFDGTTEKKSGAIDFVIMDSLSNHIL